MNSWGPPLGNDLKLDCTADHSPQAGMGETATQANPLDGSDMSNLWCSGKGKIVHVLVQPAVFHYMS